MQRSRLRNIVNKSKEFSKPIGESPFELFKKSLPEGLVNDNYRLESAWKAYGSPKNYKEALWNGLIQPIDETTIKLPSIGYNEETDEYEYLNKGRENETVDKDIRVWDNDVIPLVKELKLGGYVRTFNEEKDCWTYSKNSQKGELPIEDNELQINLFLKGGSFSEWYKKVPKDKSNTDDYDLERAYNELIKTKEGQKELEDFINIPEKHLSGDYKKPNHPTYGGYGGWINKNGLWNYYISPILIENYPNRDLNWYKNYWDLYEPESILHWIDGSIYKRKIQEFKQGGQMNVIPEGALHAHKNHMEGAGEDFTAKGIPVIDNDGNQTAEIEREEIILNLDLTNYIEEKYKKFNSDDYTEKEKDEIAIKVGKRLVKELMTNTDDKVGLIESVALKEGIV